MRYLLDTNVCIDYLTGRYPKLVERWQSLAPEAVSVSAIAVAELRYGAEKSARPVENHRRLDVMLEDLAVLHFDADASAAYGKLRAALERRGMPIGANDMLIAAQALAHELVLVTDNVAEFQRIRGLRLVNWRRGGLGSRRSR